MKYWNSPRFVRCRFWCYRQATTFLVRPVVGVLGPTIIAVTGTNGKSTVCKLLERIFREAGRRVACATSDGVRLDGVWVTTGDHAGANGVWSIVCRGVRGLVIAETARGSILRFGLGFRRCAVAVVTNIYADHLGDEGVDTLDQMAGVKARIVQRSGTAVLNADDDRVRAMAGVCRGRVIFFTVRGREAKLEDCFFLRDEALWRKRAGVEKRMVAVRDVCIAAGGLLDFHIENALAVLAAVEAIRSVRPVPEEAALRALADFGRDPHDNLGRCTFIRFAGARVLLLESKNPEGFQRARRLIDHIRKNFRVPTVVGLLTEVGGRNDAHYEAESEIVNSTCDQVAVSAPHERYWRFRTDGELVQILSSKIDSAKLIPDGMRNLDELARELNAPGGDTLFVVFNSLDDPRVDLSRILREGEVLPFDRQ